MRNLAHIPNPFPRLNRFIIGGLIVAAATIYLMANALSASAVYYLEVDELLAQGAAAYGEPVRLNGTVDQASVDWDSTTLTLEFTMVKGEQSIHVIYHGIPPDTFYSGESAVVEGELGEDGIFRAENLFVRCPSKYEAATPESS